ncbi:MAG: glycosyltransferase [Bacteroidetes bacterium]|nr:MAG: glycosyltransferase [Bacteroidota bacterium]MBL1143870.1 glycosyltransferase [Bacteroidota bacterium]NOG56671.1 glycosyltransferase [Bacteroidota bacterium]
MILLFVLIAFFYGVLIASFIWGNLRMKSPRSHSALTTSVSVVIPFRNEEGVIEKLAKALLNQDFPKSLVEFVFVNDHSTDGGKEKLIACLMDSKLKYSILELTAETGKKAALNRGILQATGELIITTDADCWMNPLWLSSMVAQFETNKADFIVGPVVLESNHSLKANLLQTEFAALIASTSGAIGINKAFICNGANLAFKKALYIEIEPYQSNSNLASGDDVFFLHKAKAMNKKIVFANHEEAIVKTEMETNFNKFINQRVRWAAKSKQYKDSDTIAFGLIISFMNLCVLTSLLLTAFNKLAFSFLIGLLVFKFILDYLLLLSAKSWMSTKSTFKNALLLSFIYPIYAVGIALLSLGFKPQWKGRKI